MKQNKYFLANGLAKSVVLLRKGGLLEKTQFPELLSPIRIITIQKRNEKGQIVQRPRFLVQISARENFNPNVLWLRFDRRAQGVYVSADLEEWVCLNVFKNL